jgi:hypothetical protein
MKEVSVLGELKAKYKADTGEDYDKIVKEIAKVVDRSPCPVLPRPRPTPLPSSLLLLYSRGCSSVFSFLPLTHHQRLNGSFA